MGTDSKGNRLIYINYSEKNKAFLWTPPKTSSIHALTVFTLFDFEWFSGSYDKKYVERYTPYPQHNHALNLFDGHENYSLICTARNPVHRLFSAYMFNNPDSEKTPSGFREFMISLTLEVNPFWMIGTKDFVRIPDYFVRQEHLFEDYSKIPFIKNSKVFECGVLEEICQKKINDTKYGKLDIHDCYTSDMLDYLYTEYRWYFDTLGYKPEI